MSQKLNKALEQLTSAYCEEAPEEATYPYAVFSARRISDVDGIQLYSLEVNVWDQNKHYSRAECMMDEMEEKLHRCNLFYGNLMIRVLKGQRNNIPDQDKEIKRIRELFEMHIYESEE